VICALSSGYSIRFTQRVVWFFVAVRPFHLTW